MLTKEQEIEISNFKAAKELALTIEENCRCQAGVDNIFFGANLKGLGAVVLWLEKDQDLTKVKRDGKLETTGHIFCFRQVNNYKTYYNLIDTTQN